MSSLSASIKGIGQHRFPHYGRYQLSTVLNRSAPHPNDDSAGYDLIAIGPLVLEIFLFENVYRRTDAQTDENRIESNTKSSPESPCEPSAKVGSKPSFPN